MASDEYWKQWHNYLPFAIPIFNTTYYSKLDCEPSRVFHARGPLIILDHKLGLRFNRTLVPTVQFADELLCRTKILYKKTKKCHAILHQIRRRLRQKAKASPLKMKDYCFILQPKADHQGSRKHSSDFQWIGPFSVEKVPPNNNNLVRKLETNKPQILH